MFFPSTWVLKTWQCLGRWPLRSHTAWKNMWCNTNKQGLPWALHSLGSHWTKAKQRHVLKVCFHSDWGFFLWIWMLLLGLFWPVSPPIGQFQEYTPYQVSLFTVSHENEVRHLSSVIGYSLQKGISCVNFKINGNCTYLTSVCFQK